ncbi:MAG: outer membrane beta-barrel protein [Deltaproteobacteria bacterium]|nr:outer membrane beta-barrel protein [Deltaproteobacteria bacterium]
MKIVGRYILPGVLFLSFSPALHALEMHYGAGLVSEYSSNSLLLPNNEEEDWVNGAELDFSLTNKSKRVDTDVSGFYGYYTYAEGTEPDQGVYFLNALATIKLRPERLSWIVRDVLGEQEINSLDADTRDNRQRVNLFITGPDLNFQVNPSNAVTIGARWAKDDYEVTKADSKRNMLKAKWENKRSSQLTLSANAVGMMVDYDDDDVNGDYDFGVVYLEADTRFSKTDVVATLGAFKVDRDKADDVDDWGAKLVLNHRKSSRTGFGWESVRKITDSTIEFLEASESGFVGGSGISGSDSSNEQGSRDLYRLTRHAAYADYEGSSILADVSLYWEERDYEEEGLFDYDEWGVGVSFSSEITAGWRGRLSTSYTNTDNTGIKRTDKDWTADIAVDHALSRYTGFSIYTGYNNRDSDDSGSEYREWIMGATIGYHR